MTPPRIRKRLQAKGSTAGMPRSFRSLLADVIRPIGPLHLRSAAPGLVVDSYDARYEAGLHDDTWGELAWTGRGSGN